MRGWTLGVVLVLLLAGCSGASDDGAPPQLPPTPAERLEAVLAGLDAPEFDVRAAVEWWQAFVTQFPKRDYGLPNNQAAAGHLEEMLQEFG